MDNEIFQFDQRFGKAVSVTDDDQIYSVNLKIFYETIPGESICVLGSIPELGNWKEYKAHMKWTEGHIWVLEEPVLTSKPFFQYKYVLMDDEKTKMVKWEAGIDRIIDMRLLPEIHNVDELKTEQTEPTKKTVTSTKKIKNVELIDEWESFRFRFSVFHPLEQQMSIASNRGELDGVMMQRASQPRNWMFSKYGQLMRPWDCETKLPNTISGEVGQFDKSSEA